MQLLIILLHTDDRRNSLSANWFARACSRARDCGPMPILTSDRVFRCLPLDHSASAILPSALVPDPRLSHAELTPSKFLSLRLQRHSSFFEQIFQPVRDAVAENAGARPGVPP